MIFYLLRRQSWAGWGKSRTLFSAWCTLDTTIHCWFKSWIFFCFGFRFWLCWV